MIDVRVLDETLKKGTIEDKGKLWIDVTGITKEESASLEKQFNLHPLTSEDLVNSRSRVKVEEFNDYLFCVFYGIKKGNELVEIDFIIGKDFLITNHKKDMLSISTLKKDEDRVRRLMSKGLDFLFHKILDMEIDNFGPVLEKIDDIIEDLEEEATSNPKPKLLSKILELKRQIITIKKTVIPQREKISFLAKNEYKFLSKKTIPYFRDIYDHAVRVSDTVDNYREAVGNAFDAYMSAVSNNMNEVMKTLSIIATIALPLTVISGIYGTNFRILPGSTGPWGFWVMIIGMVLLCIGMLVYFRLRKWI